MNSELPLKLIKLEQELATAKRLSGAVMAKLMKLNNITSVTISYEEIDLFHYTTHLTVHNLYDEPIGGQQVGYEFTITPK